MIRLYNTMSRSIEEFKPLRNNEVKIFTCGPSIYQKAHLGNYRTFLYEDVLVRYLKFKGYSVERAMNLTDIEDKTIKEAEKKKTNIKTITDSVFENFKECLKELDIIFPDHLVPATNTVYQSVKIIEKLLEKDIAYEYKGDFFFDPQKINNFGKLFRVDMNRWPKKKIRYKKDTYNGNRWNLGDFILWHGHKNESNHPFWDTKIGKGRPSWNIQDPSVVTMTLGDQIDINCGGIDNIYRHHDYNIAIMESYTQKEYSKYYLHGEHLVVNNKTMSKSLGNIIYPQDLVLKNFEWRDIRFFLLYTHYRKKLNYNEKNFNIAVEKIKTFRKNLKTIKRSSTSFSAEAELLINNLNKTFIKEVDQDLNIKNGFDSAYYIIKKIKDLSEKNPIAKEQYEKINNSLLKIDTVLKVIYPIFPT